MSGQAIRKEKEKESRDCLRHELWSCFILQDGLSLYVILKRAAQGLREPSKNNAALNTLKRTQTSRPAAISTKGKAPRYQHRWLKISGSPRCPQYDMGGS